MLETVNNKDGSLNAYVDYAVGSSAISKAVYIAEDSDLYIQFTTSGRWYDYHGVSQTDAEGFFNSGSKGQAINDIKKAYPNYELAYEPEIINKPDTELDITGMLTGYMTELSKDLDALSYLFGEGE